MRRFILASLALAASCAAPDARQTSPLRVTAVPLDASDPARERIGRLRFMGGLHIAGSDSRIGGLSGLRWHDGALLAVSDDGRWVRFQPVEQHDRLIGIRNLAGGALHGPDGEPLDGKTKTDAEALARGPDGSWLVAFERDHRIWRYGALSAPARATALAPTALLGKLEGNNGVEALAIAGNGTLLCAERMGDNCRWVKNGANAALAIAPPAPIDRRGGVPTDADAAPDGTIFVLFRSFAPLDGPGAAIVALAPGGQQVPVATLLPPVTLDNMEGLAVRIRGQRTFLYLVSDDNFSPLQRTLLLKFEVLD